MAMTSLNVDYEKTRATGRNIQNYAGDFKTLLREIQNLNDNLKNCWTGDDATKYTGTISEQAQVMNKLQVTIQEMGEYLVTVGNEYEKAMQDNTIK